MAITLCEYTNTNENVGGMFSTGTPTRIHANRRAIPERNRCNLARMLVHECIHALSYNIKTANFSHCSNHEPDEHGDTAPYWILKKLKPMCPAAEANDEVLIVELLDDTADMGSRDIKCQ